MKSLLTQNKFLNINSKKLIFEYKERFPFLSPKEISELFVIDRHEVEKLFKEQYIIIPSKLNKKNNGKIERRKK